MQRIFSFISHLVISFVLIISIGINTASAESVENLGSTEITENEIEQAIDAASNFILNKGSH